MRLIGRLRDWAIGRLESRNPVVFDLWRAIRAQWLYDEQMKFYREVQQEQEAAFVEDGDLIKALCDCCQEKAA